MEFKKVAVAIALSAGLASVGLQAATNPSAPTSVSSTGDFNITLIAQPVMQLHGLTDVSFDTTVDDPSADLSGSTPSCVDSNVATYEVTLTSLNATNAGNALFELSDGNTNTIPYTLTYSQTGGATDVVWGAGNNGSGVAGGTFTKDGDIGDISCSLGTKITVDILQTDYVSVPIGTYADTVTVEVAAL